MDYISVIGTVAAILTTAANIPQTYKMIKTKSTKDISAITYSMLLLGFLLWVAYGIFQQDYPVIIANGISVLISTTILSLKFIPSKMLDRINAKITPED